jgi:acetaldehyde dehydrogenase/alcohol dehydrogenase
LSDMLALRGTSDDDKVYKLVEAIEGLKTKVNIPLTLKEIIGADREAEFFANVDDVAERAFDDSCTSANCRYPLIEDLKNILTTAWDTPVLETYADEKNELIPTDAEDIYKYINYEEEHFVHEP